MSTSKTGKEGEKLAKEFLINAGYDLLATNYRYKRGEIDLIAKQKGMLVFVEVKTRSNLNYGHPEEAVDERKVEKVMETAEQYVIENNWNGPIRFDILSVTVKKSKEPVIVHFKDAFY